MKENGIVTERMREERRKESSERENTNERKKEQTNEMFDWDCVMYAQMHLHTLNYNQFKDKVE